MLWRISARSRKRMRIKNRMKILRLQKKASVLRTSGRPETIEKYDST